MGTIESVESFLIALNGLSNKLAKLYFGIKLQKEIL